MIAVAFWMLCVVFNFFLAGIACERNTFGMMAVLLGCACICYGIAIYVGFSLQEKDEE